MLTHTQEKYTRFSPIPLPNRQWPNRTIQTPPRWMSTDLRDGNQALVDPMDVDTKLAFFQLLVQCGFKEIEVAFPSASQTDFDCVRRLIEEQRIPDDVTIEVITQSRPELIERTFEALHDIPRAIVHLYNPIAPAWRNWVFQLDKEGVKQLALQGTRHIRELTRRYPDTAWTYQYSPETFSAAEPELALDICNAVIDAWGLTPDNKMIINLPATVEMSTPNTYADQIEWMHRRLHKRDSVILSVHPHNDRGTAVAAAELAVMAGADRVEGCLFGNGERTGNVDLVTLAMNLYSQGVHPGLDFSRIDDIKHQVEQFNQLPVHPRHPYAGELVYTAFSGSHQDAIKKGMACQQPNQPWQVPYLPIDPADVGRQYTALIRVNSQSGKGGISYLLQQEYGLVLPRLLQMDFSPVVQQHSDATGQEVTAPMLHSLFMQTYCHEHPRHCITFSEHAVQGETNLSLEVQHYQQVRQCSGSGKGILDALLHALDTRAYISDYHEHALTQGSDAQAVCYVELSLGQQRQYGVGIDSNITGAAIKAVISALNRLEAGKA